MSWNGGCASCSARSSASVNRVKRVTPMVAATSAGSALRTTSSTGVGTLCSPSSCSGWYVRLWASSCRCATCSTRERPRAWPPVSPTEPGPYSPSSPPALGRSARPCRRRRNGSGCSSNWTPSRRRTTTRCSSASADPSTTTPSGLRSVTSWRGTRCCGRGSRSSTTSRSRTYCPSPIEVAARGRPGRRDRERGVGGVWPAPSTWPRTRRCGSR